MAQIATTGRLERSLLVVESRFRDMVETAESEGPD
jgi:hypothetical protein